MCVLDAFLVGGWLPASSWHIPGALALLSLGSLLADCQGLIAHVETLVAQSEVLAAWGEARRVQK